MSNLSIAVLIPCYNEALTIAQVVHDFKTALPTAAIYVYDNNSSDSTFAEAKESGAIVCCEPLQGKGNVVRRMFADIDADIYLMVDGDATYDANSAKIMLDKLIDEQLDMVVACRKEKSLDAYRAGHRLGNLFFNKIVEWLFGRAFTDIFSGYRAFTRRFVKSFPASSSGFEIELELTVHSLQMRLRTGEVDTPYYSRPVGSQSKLHSYRDGFRILKVVVDLILSERPLLLFGTLFALLSLFSIFLFVPIVWNYLETGLVPRFPTLFIAGFVGLFAVMCLFFGYLFDRIAQARREMKRICYLSIKNTALKQDRANSVLNSHR